MNGFQILGIQNQLVISNPYILSGLVMKAFERRRVQALFINTSFIFQCQDIASSSHQLERKAASPCCDAYHLTLFKPVLSEYPAALLDLQFNPFHVLPDQAENYMLHLIWDNSP
jgi:hypothetical protein